MFDATPSDAAGYVFAAYLFFLLMVLVYISILGAKFQRINRELSELIDELKAEDAARDEPVEAADSPPREESSV
jgi:hypothetical protein